MSQDVVQRIAIDRELNTSRCRLRYPRLADIPRLQSAFASPLFPRDLPLAELITAEQVTHWIQGCKSRWAEGEGYTWTVEDKTTGTVVGQVSLFRLPSAGVWSLAFWTHPDSWGQGYATEAAQRVIRLAFEELAANRIWAAAATWNAGSLRVLDKLGMAYLQENPEGYTIHERPIPTREFEITRAAWEH